jgi:hypothetical protein
MRGAKDNIDCWPTREQELLLLAALLEGKDAVSAWEEWRSSVDLERIDPGSFRLLPLLYHNLTAQGVEDPLINPLKELHRNTWYQNRILLNRAVALLDSFNGAGIKTVLLKGIALTILYYKDFGIRPMGDIDVLVPTEKAIHAIGLLRKMGWIPSYKSPEAIIPIIHGCDFVDSLDQYHIDLHWHLFIECCQPDSDDDFWDGALPITVKGVSTYVLNPADELLHTCVHGVKWSPIPPFRWVADAMMIMRSSKAEIDWNRLIRLAEKHRLILPLRHALRYLLNRFGAPVPTWVLDSLEKMPTSRIEHMEYRYKTENHENKLLGNIPVLWFDFLRLRRGRASPQKRLIGFLGYVQRFWDLEHMWQIPLYALSLGLRKIRTVAGYYWRK